MSLNFPYYYGHAGEQYAFFRIPKLLITDSRFDGVSSDAKLLYLRYPDWKNWISYHIAPIFRGRTHSPVTWCSIQLCRGALLKSAFAAAKIPVYDSVLYAGGVSLPDHENCIRIGKELQLCGEEDDANEIVTRRDAAMLLHAILTRAFAVTAPAAPVTLVNAAGVNINDYLLALRQVPEPVLAAFNAAGWTYRIDFDYISELSKQLNMSCIGATNYSQKTIYLSEAGATLHEFGHFLDWTLGIPAEHEQLYLAEAQNSGLRDYAKTNAREYFADCFDYWIAYSGSEKRMETFRNAAPQTWAYFEALEKNNWRS